MTITYRNNNCGYHTYLELSWNARLSWNKLCLCYGRMHDLNNRLGIITNYTHCHVTTKYTRTRSNMLCQASSLCVKELKSIGWQSNTYQTPCKRMIYTYANFDPFIKLKENIKYQHNILYNFSKTQRMGEGEIDHQYNSRFPDSY